MFNGFQKFFKNRALTLRRLGMPTYDAEHQRQRLEHMARLTGGRGFRHPEKRTDPGDRYARRKEIRKLMRPKYSIPQPAKYRNASTRKS